MRADISAEAERDLVEIADYIALDNRGRALTFVEELRRRCDGLLDFPESHPLRPEFGRDVRAAVHGKYLILYAARRDVLQILRVIHGARDLSRIGPL
jgi:plasmid stabilization system protein ParE